MSKPSSRGPDDGPEPYRTTPKRLAKSIEDWAVEISAVAIRGRKLGAFVPVSDPRIDAAVNALLRQSQQLSDLSLGVLIGQVPIVPGLAELRHSPDRPLLDRMESTPEIPACVECGEPAERLAADGATCWPCAVQRANDPTRTPPRTAPEPRNGLVELPAAKCRECGSTDAEYRAKNGVGRHWVEPDLCFDCGGEKPKSKPKRPKKEKPPPPEPEPIPARKPPTKSFDVFAGDESYRILVGTIKAKNLDEARVLAPDVFKGQEIHTGTTLTRTRPIRAGEIEVRPTPKSPAQRDAMYAPPKPEPTSASESEGWRETALIRMDISSTISDALRSAGIQTAGQLADWLDSPEQLDREKNPMGLRIQMLDRLRAELAQLRPAAAQEILPPPAQYVVYHGPPAGPFRRVCLVHAHSMGEAHEEAKARIGWQLWNFPDGLRIDGPGLESAVIAEEREWLPAPFPVPRNGASIRGDGQDQVPQSCPDGTPRVYEVVYHGPDGIAVMTSVKAVTKADAEQLRDRWLASHRPTSAAFRYDVRPVKEEKARKRAATAGRQTRQFHREFDRDGRSAQAAIERGVPDPDPEGVIA